MATLTLDWGVGFDITELPDDEFNIELDLSEYTGPVAGSTGTFSGDLSVIGIIDLVHTAVIADEHALEIVVEAAGFGDIKALDIDYITGAISTGEDEGVILLNIDELDSTGGEIFGLEVLATEGSATVFGMKTGVGIGPIHQNVGSFANPTLATDNTTAADVAAMRDNNVATTTAIFENDDEYILIGAAAAFSELEIVLATVSSKDAQLTFGYSIAGAHLFTPFTPVDGTNGFRNTGIISWDAGDLVNHAVNTDTGTFDIKITTTRNGSFTRPVLGYIRSAAVVEYLWDKDANLEVATLVSGIVTTGSIVSSAGKITLVPASGPVDVKVDGTWLQQRRVSDNAALSAVVTTTVDGIANVAIITGASAGALGKNSVGYFYADNVKAKTLVPLEIPDDKELRFGDAPDYWLQYVSASSYLALTSTDSDGGGTNADIIRILDGQLTVDGNSTFDDGAFDYVCDGCGRHEAKEFVCCGRVQWHDDVALALAVSRNEPTAIAQMEKLGLIRRYDDGWLGMSWQKPIAFTWSALGQIMQRIEALEGQRENYA